jgi:hypothetical protein
MDEAVGWGIAWTRVIVAIAKKANPRPVIVPHNEMGDVGR